MNTSSNMPVWVDDSHMDPEWLWAKTKIRASQVSAKDISTNQGRVGSVPRKGGTLLLSLDANELTTTTSTELVLKQITRTGTANLSRQLGLAREAFFYRDLAPRLHVRSCRTPTLLPKIYYAYGDPATGEKCIIMESLSSWIDSGILFGPHAETSFRSNPNNWDRNLPELIATAYGNRPVPSTRTVAQITFESIAMVHASFWRDTSLLEDSKQWLRGHAWLQGRGKESWEASQSLIQTIWKDYTNTEHITIKSGIKDAGIQWDPVVRTAVEKCVEGISWQSQLDRLSLDGRWTLVHGDFWPGNIMWDPNTTTSSTRNLRLLDWEMVGLGSGPQDLGYVVSSVMKLCVLVEYSLSVFSHCSLGMLKSIRFIQHGPSRSSEL